MNAPTQTSLGGVPSHQRPEINDSSDSEWAAHCAWLYERHYEYLVNVAQRVIVDRTLAEDCVQDVFLKYFDKRPQHDPDRTEGYLRSMARNAAISAVRVESRYVGDEFLDGGVAPSAEDVALPGLMAEELMGGLDDLSGRQQEVVACRLAGMSVGATANLLDISTGSVKTHRHRAARSFADSEEFGRAA